MLKLFTWLKQYWWVPIVGASTVVLTVKVFKLLKKRPQADETKANTAIDNYQTSNGVKISAPRRAKLNKVASELAHHIGTAYSWWNPRSWTENDENIYNLLKPLDQQEFDVVKHLYFYVYTKGRSLLSDLVANLDEKYYKKLNLT